MLLYDIIVENDLSKYKPSKGKIWCSNGTFVEPEKFRGSYDNAYGYMLTDDTAVRIWRSPVAMIWSEDYDLDTGSKVLDGYSVSNWIGNLSTFSKQSYPAMFHVLNQSNDGVKGYMPSIHELSLLYKSIMSGNMAFDLLESGLYDYCNYRLNDSSENGWNYIWSVNNDSKPRSYYLHYNGNESIYDKKYGLFVIPFYKFKP